MYVLEQLGHLGGVEQLLGLQHHLVAHLVAHLEGRVHPAPVQRSLALLLRRLQQRQHLLLKCDISRFLPRIDRIFFGKALIHFLVLKMKDFRNFVPHNCILAFDAEQVYLKPQVINLKNNEVTVNPKPQTLRKIWFFENPIP